MVAFILALTLQSSFSVNSDTCFGCIYNAMLQTHVILWYIPYVAKYWWGKILANLASRSHVAKINPTKILPLNTQYSACDNN